MMDGHIPAERVRSYLLGQLPDDLAAAIEMAYFTEPSFFHRVQEAERSLIEDYLDSRLDRATRVRFEERYLLVPLLKARVEEVRSHKQIDSATAPRFRFWKLHALLASFAALLLLFVWNSGWRNIATFHIKPGVPMSVQSSGNWVLAGKSGKTLRLIFDLPGTRSQVTCRVRISTPGQGGTKSIVWGPPELLVSASANQGQELTLLVGSRVLPSGIYLAELMTPNGELYQSYMFRVFDSIDHAR